MNPQRQRQPQQMPIQRHSVQSPAAPPSDTPKRRRTRQPFRAEYLLIPMVLLLFMWIIAGTDGPGFSFDDWMSLMNVRDREQYRQLATFGVVVTTIVWITKVVKSPHRRG